MIKVLNLYAGLGGNRKLWKDVDVTAVEIDPIIAKEYQKNFPDDTVIVADAKEYLINHFREFDFIWASPPCPTHSKFRMLWKGEGRLKNKKSGSSYKLPDMELYSIIIFLQHFFQGTWIVENVISYYDPLIRPFIVDNHYFWSNKNLGYLKRTPRNITQQDLQKKSSILDIPIPDIHKSKRYIRTLLNNCVHPEIGLYVFNMASKDTQKPIAIYMEESK